MRLSAHNYLSGVIRSVRSGTVMADVTVGIGAGLVTAVITESSGQNVGLAEGDPVTVVIKSTEVMISKI
jgi:molybdopterin-binding protein